MSLIFVDCEADFNSPCPGIGPGMTEFGAVEFKSRKTFHGKPIIDRQYSGELSNFSFPYRADEADEDFRKWYDIIIEFDKWIQQFESPFIFVSDNPAYDWQWINYWFHRVLNRNPFGWSARRIGDFYAGLVGNFRAGSKWKRLRITKHNHNPVNDAMGNCEAFQRIMDGER